MVSTRPNYILFFYEPRRRPFGTKQYNKEHIQLHDIEHHTTGHRLKYLHTKIGKLVVRCIYKVPESRITNHQTFYRALDKPAGRNVESEDRKNQDSLFTVFI